MFIHLVIKNTYCHPIMLFERNYKSPKYNLKNIYKLE